MPRCSHMHLTPATAAAVNIILKMEVGARLRLVDEVFGSDRFKSNDGALKFLIYSQILI